MPMKKEGAPEKFTVLHGEEAQVLNNHFAKTGKFALSEFDKEELKAFEDELATVAKDVAEDAVEDAV